MKAALVLAALLTALALARCAHGPPAHWDLPNPQDAGPELRWG